MHEIKFRGLRTDTGEWEYGWIYKLDHPDHREKAFIMPSYASASYSYAVDAATVGQYTGLKDKNGKEIFEGDVLKVPDLYETPENTSMTYHNEVVDFGECSYRLGGQPLCNDAAYVSDECEVIGNRWEHPNLLGGNQPNA